MRSSRIPTALRELLDVARSVQNAQSNQPSNEETWSLPAEPMQRNRAVYWMRNDSSALPEPHSSTTVPDVSARGSQQPAVRDAEGAARNGASTSGRRLGHFLRSMAFGSERVRKKEQPTRYYCARSGAIVYYDVRTPPPPGRTMMHGAHVRRLRRESDGLLSDDSEQNNSESSLSDGTPTRAQQPASLTPPGGNFPETQPQAHHPQFELQSRISVPLAQHNATTAQRGRVIRFRQSLALITNGTEQTTPPQGNVPETHQPAMQWSPRGNAESAQLDDPWNEDTWIIPPIQSQAHHPQSELQSRTSVPLAQHNATTAQRGRVNRFRQSRALITNGTEQNSSVNSLSDETPTHARQPSSLTPPQGNVPGTHQPVMQWSPLGNAEAAQLEYPWNEDTWIIPPSQSQAHPPQFELQSRTFVPLAQHTATTAQRGRGSRFRQSRALITA